MKKKLLLFILLLIPFMVNAKEKEVKITSVELVELSDSATELSKGTYNGLELNLNLRFTEVGDKAKYKVVVENTTDEDYEIINEETQLDSGYITYESTYEEDSNIIKSNTTKTLFVTISYDKEVDDDKYTNGKYTESNSVIINLDTKKNNKNVDNDIKVNPKTGIRIGLIISGIGLLMGIIALLLCWIPYVNITCTILAFILGIIGIAKNSGKGQAIAGVVLSVIAAIPTIIIMIFLNAIFGALGWFGAHIDNATEYWFNTLPSATNTPIGSRFKLNTEVNVILRVVGLKKR